MAPGTVDRLQALAREEGASFYMALHAAFDILLHRYSGQDDIAVGMPVDSRDRPELEHFVGVFVDTVVLRVDLSGNPTFRELLGRVRARMLDAIGHQRLPFEQLVRALQPDRDLGRHPLYQVMLTLVPMEPPPQAEGLEVEEITPERASSPIDLTVFLEQRGDGLDAVWEYSTDLFDLETVERMQSHFQRLLDAVVSEPDRPVDELAMVTDAERAQMVAGPTGTAADYPVACLHELFEQRAAAAPDAPAVTYEQTTLSYRELNERANRLAHRLRELGVGPETPVALCLHRSLELVVAILGVLKAGGAYVPLDPDYPAERLEFVLADTRAPVLITEEELLAQLPAHDAAVVLPRPRRHRARRAERREPRAAGRARKPGLRDLHVGLDRAAEGGPGRAPPSRPALHRDRPVVRVRPGRDLAPVPLLRVRLLRLGAVGRARPRRAPRDRPAVDDPLPAGARRPARRGAGHGAERHAEPLRRRAGGAGAGRETSSRSAWSSSEGRLSSLPPFGPGSTASERTGLRS